MAPQTNSQLGYLRPSRLRQAAVALALLAGVLGLVSAVLAQAELGFSGLFWLRLLLGLGFLFSGILQLMARKQRSLKSADIGSSINP